MRDRNNGKNVLWSVLRIGSLPRSQTIPVFGGVIRSLRYEPLAAKALAVLEDPTGTIECSFCYRSIDSAGLTVGRSVLLKNISALVLRNSCAGLVCAPDNILCSFDSSADGNPLGPAARLLKKATSPSIADTDSASKPQNLPPNQTSIVQNSAQQPASRPRSKSPVDPSPPSKRYPRRSHPPAPGSVAPASAAPTGISMQGCVGIGNTGIGSPLGAPRGPHIVRGCGSGENAWESGDGGAAVWDQQESLRGGGGTAEGEGGRSGQVAGGAAGGGDGRLPSYGAAELLGGDSSDGGFDAPRPIRDSRAPGGRGGGRMGEADGAEGSDGSDSEWSDQVIGAPPGFVSQAQLTQQQRHQPHRHAHHTPPASQSLAPAGSGLHSPISPVSSRASCQTGDAASDVLDF